MLRRQKSSTKRSMAMKMRSEEEGTMTSGNRVWRERTRSEM